MKEKEAKKTTETIMAYALISWTAHGEKIDGLILWLKKQERGGTRCESQTKKKNDTPHNRRGGQVNDLYLKLAATRSVRLGGEQRKNRKGGANGTLATRNIRVPWLPGTRAGAAW